MRRLGSTTRTQRLSGTIPRTHVAAGYRGIEMNALSVNEKPQHCSQQAQKKNELAIQQCLSIAPIDNNQRIYAAPFLLLSVHVFRHVTFFSTRIILKPDARAGDRASLPQFTGRAIVDRERYNQKQ